MAAAPDCDLATPASRVVRESWAARSAEFAALLGFVCVCWVAGTGSAEAQLGSLLSPGRLAKAHSHLEGIKNCSSCHEQGRRVTAAKCLACHKPVAERIAKKLGVHRDVGNDCVTCHAEHAGVDGELRRFDQSGFDHAAVARFPLVGKHAPIAAQCAACHKTRSFLTLAPACATCHQDFHKGSLGQNCASCHTVQMAFKDAGTQFDHSKAQFQLTGAHKTVACEKCHVNRVFKGLKFGTCADCHKDPHRGTFTPACTTCHANDSWRTRKVDHSKTAFPLLGKHTAVACASCHKQAPMQVKPKAATCATCHVDPHRGAFKQDCKSCHSESGFAKAPFDHSKTAFPLTGKHEPLACNQCHKTIATTGVPIAKRVADFRGLKTDCVSCHTDQHQGELGQACEKCHSPATFKVTAFTHTGFPEFFTGQHDTATCAGCHTRGQDASPAGAKPAATNTTTTARVIAATFKDTPTTCASCHRDVHLGQVGRECQGCHSIQVAKFGLAGFSHSRTGFELKDKHEAVACAKCHKSETAAFPAGTGTAVRLKGLGTECRSCHADVHLGQLPNTCEQCHATTGFKLTSYRHQTAEWSQVFVGRHARAACAACHKPVTRQFPSGRGTAVHFKVDARCVACHKDVHNGSLGTRCIECHRP